MRAIGRRAGLIALACLPSLAGAQDIRHEESPVWSGSSVRDNTMTVRLRDAAQDYRQNAPIPRIALYDLCFPANAAEFQQLGGNGVLLVTAVVQDSTELPAPRVYVRDASHHDRDLHRLGLACGRLPDRETRIAATFGAYRCDALYVLPVAVGSGAGELFVDFAAHREGFRLARFGARWPEWLEGVTAASSEPVADSTFNAFIRREYPGPSARILQR